MPVLMLGKISVPTPGTPVKLTTTAEYQALAAQGMNPAFFTCQAVLFQAWKANTGAVYVGRLGLNRTTGAAVSAVLGIPTDGSIPSHGASNHLAPAGIDLSVYYLDADQANDGALVSLLVT